MPSHNIGLLEWESKSPANCKELEGVFLDYLTGNDLTKKLKGKLEIVELRNGISVEASSYVGRISIDGIRITVKPKITGIPLLRLFQYTYNLKSLELLSLTEYATSFETFHDLIIAQLILEVKTLLSRGVYRKYVQRNEYLESPRGRIDFLKYVRNRQRQEIELPCIHDPRLKDCLLNQVLLGGLDKAASCTNIISLKSECHRLASSLMDEVSSIKIDWEIFRKAYQGVDRLTAAYKPALELIRIILESEGFSLDGMESKTKLPGFLFDMNRFFQDLISRFLHKNLIGYLVQDEYRLKGMLSYIEGYNPQGKKDPEPRPDYIVHKDSKVKMILDAKYRDLWNKPLPREMLYQLSIYALSQVSDGKATILYPTLDESAKEARIQITEPLFGKNRGLVILRPINLIYFSKIISDSTDPDYQRKKGEFAKELVFGTTEG